MIDAKENGTFRAPVHEEMQPQISYDTFHDPEDPEDRNETNVVASALDEIKQFEREESIKTSTIEVNVGKEDEDESDTQDEEDEDDSKSWNSYEEESQEMSYKYMAIYTLAVIIIIGVFVSIGITITNGSEKSTLKQESSMSMTATVSVNENKDMKEIDHKDVDEYDRNDSEEKIEETTVLKQKKENADEVNKNATSNKKQSKLYTTTQEVNEKFALNKEEEEGDKRYQEEKESILEAKEEVKMEAHKKHEVEAKEKESNGKKCFKYWFKFFIGATVILAICEVISYALKKWTSTHFFIPDFIVWMYGCYFIVTLIIFFIYCCQYGCPFTCKCNDDSKECCKNFTDVLNGIALMFVAFAFIAGRIAMRVTTNDYWTTVDLEISGYCFFGAFCLFIIVSIINCSIHQK